MKIDRTEFVGTFQTSLGTWEKCTMSTSIGEGEDPIECYLKLRETAIAAHKKANPQLYKNGNEAIVDGYNGTRMDEFIQRENDFDESARKMFGIPPRKPLVINREYERKSIEIENVSSLEELATFKEYCGKNPDLMTAYTNKLRELTNKIKV